MKKIIVMLLTVVLLFSFAGCGNSKNKTESGESSLTISEEINEKITELFIIDGAQLVDSTAGKIIYTSPVSLDETTTFLKNAVKEFGAKTIEETEKTGYIFSGNYDGGKKITIVALDREEVTSVMIYYG
ncbi:MAG TPA: hypothetical protein DEQ02_10305 [Ruminococcaceae bacterium]|nr:hypothetical protein [Oscillospiraceae bacterium]